ncbi:MAG TPA: hypothetical protein VGM56_20345 [Byssovorax sp.]|jgi:hypothetical protein
MTRAACLALIASSLFLAACTESEPDESTGIAAIADVIGDRAPASPPAAAARFAAATRAGDVALVDARDLSIVSTTALDDDAALVDLAMDPSGAALYAFVTDDDGQSGELLRASIAGDVLGPLEHVTWLDGVAHIEREADATLAFVHGYADQWKLLRDDGAPTSSLAMIAPVSLSAGAGSLDLLAADASGALGLYRVDRAASAWPPAAPLDLGHASSALTAQLVDAPRAGDACASCALTKGWLADVDAGDVSLRPIDADGLGAPVTIDVGASGAVIEAAVARCDGTVTLLLSGAELVVRARLDDTGDLAAVDALNMPAPIAPRGPGFSRAWVDLGGDAIAIATSNGVVVVDARPGFAPPAWTSSELRAPLTDVVTRP